MCLRCVPTDAFADRRTSIFAETGPPFETESAHVERESAWLSRASPPTSAGGVPRPPMRAGYAASAADGLRLRPRRCEYLPLHGVADSDLRILALSEKPRRAVRANVIGPNAAGAVGPCARSVLS